MNSLVAELLKNSMEELILMVYLLFRNIYIANEYLLEMYICMWYVHIQIRKKNALCLHSMHCSWK